MRAFIPISLYLLLHETHSLDKIVSIELDRIGKWCQIILPANQSQESIPKRIIDLFDNKKSQFIYNSIKNVYFWKAAMTIVDHKENKEKKWHASHPYHVYICKWDQHFFKWNTRSCVGKWISFPSAGLFHLFRWIKRTRQPIFFNRISTCHQYMSALCSAQNTYSALRSNYMCAEGKRPHKWREKIHQNAKDIRNLHKDIEGIRVLDHRKCLRFRQTFHSI